MPIEELEDGWTSTMRSGTLIGRVEKDRIERQRRGSSELAAVVVDYYV